MLRVNGLFGWIKANDRRSLALFGGFALALQFGAALLLYVPLAGLDPAHAPFENWGGYALRYMPLVVLVAALAFGAQMLWHVGSVRRLLDFHFIDNRDEPRLCAIIEPLAIGMGLPAPYVGVIESPALNAFACGVRRSDAVIVVTRGLIDGLDDEELAAVVAHELAHIANGDIRLMAAANICLGMLRRLMMPHRRRRPVYVEALTIPVLIFLMPPMFVAVMILAFLSQLSVRAGHLVRALIGASREFVADAAAVEATQNPAALVSALRRIHGRSAIAGMPPGQDAMMIDGAATGAYATHPSIAERIKALVAVTGSMALIAPSRRDTRTHGPGGGFGRRVAGPTDMELAADPHRLSLTEMGDGEHNWLGLSRWSTWSAMAGLVAYVGVHTYQSGDPLKVAMAFDPRPAVTAVVAMSRGMTCGYAQVAGVKLCDPAQTAELDKKLAAQPGAFGRLASQMGELQAQGGTFRSGPGALNDSAPAALIAQEVKAKRCFVTDSYTVGHFGIHRPIPGGDPTDRERERFDIDRWLGSGDDAAAAVVAAAAAPDAALGLYVTKRKERLRMVHAYFAEDGLNYGLQHFSRGDHAAALETLRGRLADPAFVKAQTPAALAEMQLLSEAPGSFVPCEVRERQARVAAGLTTSVPVGAYSF